MKNRYKAVFACCLIMMTVAIKGCIDFDFNFTEADVKTSPATNISETSATLNGQVNANNGTATASFYYYAGDAGQQMSAKAIPEKVTGDKWTKVSADIGGLSAGTIITYYLCTPGFTANCSENETFATTFLPEQLFKGGIKFYTDSTGEHGLIAAPFDQSRGIEWANNGVTKVTGSSGIALGTGQSNTAAIVATHGAGTYAAKICDDLVLYGYSDWFLPSKDELNLLYLNRNLVGGLNPNKYYWSSSEVSASDAWSQSFSSGIQNSKTFKLKNLFNVRAVRAY